MILDAVDYHFKSVTSAHIFFLQTPEKLHFKLESIKQKALQLFFFDVAAQLKLKMSRVCKQERSCPVMCVWLSVGSCRQAEVEVNVISQT